jgi:hypothetical protein
MAEGGGGVLTGHHADILRPGTSPALCQCAPKEGNGRQGGERGVAADLCTPHRFHFMPRDVGGRLEGCPVWRSSDRNHAEPREKLSQANFRRSHPLGKRIGDLYDNSASLQAAWASAGSNPWLAGSALSQVSESRRVAPGGTFRSGTPFQCHSDREPALNVDYPLSGS